MLIVLLVVVARCPAPAWGQHFSPIHSTTADDAPPQLSLGSLRPGTRIRVRVLGPKDKMISQTGSLVSIQGDSLRFFAEAQPGDFVVLPLSEIERVESYAGRKSRWLTGAGIGAGTLALAGGIAGYAAGEDQPSGWCCDLSKGQAAAGGAMLGAVSGFLLGAIVGAAIHTDRWREVDTQRVGLSVGLTPSGAVGFTATIRF